MKMREYGSYQTRDQGNGKTMEPPRPDSSVELDQCQARTKNNECRCRSTASATIFCDRGLNSHIRCP